MLLSDYDSSSTGSWRRSNDVKGWRDCSHPESPTVISCKSKTSTEECEPVWVSKDDQQSVSIYKLKHWDQTEIWNRCRFDYPDLNGKTFSSPYEGYHGVCHPFLWPRYYSILVKLINERLLRSTLRYPYHYNDVHNTWRLHLNLETHSVSSLPRNLVDYST